VVATLSPWRSWVQIPSRVLVSQVVERQTRQVQNLVPTGHEGSSPSLATFFFRGRLTAGRRALNPQVLARLQPPELGCPGGETDIMALSEGAGPGSIPGRGTDLDPWGVVEARRPAKAEVMQVRFLPGILWPNPKRQRDPAVNRGRVGSTPTGHPELRCSSDGKSVPLKPGRPLARTQPPELVLPRSSVGSSDPLLTGRS
jgi:hypothetical protein